jgi:RNA polymerase sigma-70 factor (sigma-E family)
MAYILSGDTHSAADLVQETLVTLYVKWPKIRGVENIDGYVRMILLRQFLQERRRPWARIRLTGTVLDQIASVPPVPMEERSELVAALRQVPARQRSAVVLRFVYDLPVEEVAVLLGCGAGTVKSQTSRGLAALRRLLEQPAVVHTSARSADGH